MIIIAKIFILIGLVRLLIATSKPLLCATIYASAGFIFGLLVGVPFLQMLIASIVGFGLATLYFWLLNRFEDNHVLWWIILIVGLLIGLV